MKQICFAAVSTEPWSDYLQGRAGVFWVFVVVVNLFDFSFSPL